MDTIDIGTPSDKLWVGATAIAENIFQGKVSARAVYRMAARGDWPFFDLQGKIAAWERAMRAEMDRRAGVTPRDTEAA